MQPKVPFFETETNKQLYRYSHSSYEPEE